VVYGGGFHVTVIVFLIFLEPMFYVYVLISLKDKKFYIGYTGNLKRRLKEQNSAFAC
jgi:hypothetical protein